MGIGGDENFASPAVALQPQALVKKSAEHPFIAINRSSWTSAGNWQDELFRTHSTTGIRFAPFSGK